MSFPVSDAYNFSREGVWGAVTSTLDFCEPNFQFSDYVAEMANTLSNLVTIVIALNGARMTKNEGLPARYVFGYATLLIVGIGSFAFHATLLHTAQLSDELPMIYAASCSFFVLADSCPGFKIIGNKKSTLILITVVLFNVLFTYSYWVYRNPIYHQAVFGILLLGTVVRGTQLLRSSEMSHKLGPGEKQQISNLYRTGALTFAFGFFIWNLDNIYCNALSRWKSTIGWPTAFLLEGHSWWHLLTIIGAYYMAIGTTYLTLSIKDDRRNYMVVYDWGCLPRVKRTTKVKD